MNNYVIDTTVFLSAGGFRYIEDFVREYTDDSVIEQALQGVSPEDYQKVYNKYILGEFIRESIYSGRLERGESADTLDEDD